MGQRHQTFLIVPNVYKKVEDWLFNGDTYRMEEARKNADKEGDKETQITMKDGNRREFIEYDFAKIAETFGDEFTTVLAHHHQWLYGASAVATVQRVLEFTKRANKYSSPFNPHYWMNKMVDLRTIPWFLDFVNAILTTKTNYDFLDKIGGEIGYDNCTFLNLENPKSRHYYDDFQNDDLVSVVDTIEKKYCFIDITQLPHLILSAPQYYERYYPRLKKDVDDYKLARVTDEELEKWLIQNQENFVFIENYFKDFNLMTKEDLVHYFPKMFRQLGYKKMPLLLRQQQQDFISREGQMMMMRRDDD